jgi:hypothetical protein
MTDLAAAVLTRAACAIRGSTARPRSAGRIDAVHSLMVLRANGRLD